MDAVSIFIDINKWIIDINNFIYWYGLNVKTAAHMILIPLIIQPS